MEVGESVHLFHDSRTNPCHKWVKRRAVLKAPVVGRAYDVLSIDSVAITVRRTSLEPQRSMLILDTRLGPAAVRPLSEREAWRICSLPEDQLDWLCERGYKATPLAGNAVPGTMTKVIWDALLPRLQLYSDAVAQAPEPPPPPTTPAPPQAKPSKACSVEQMLSVYLNKLSRMV